MNTFQQQTRQMVISDPCYRAPSLTLRAEKGAWHVEYESGLFLEAYLDGCEKSKLKRHSEVASDAGLQSIFDKRYYSDPEEMAGLVSEKAVSREIERAQKLEDSFGVTTTHKAAWTAAYINMGDLLITPHGVMASTHWGDGIWPVYVARRFKGGGVCRVAVVFDDEKRFIEKKL